MKDANLNTSCEVTLFDNSVMANINKLKEQHICVVLASIYKELTKNLQLNNFTEDNLKNRINELLVSGKIIDKPNRDCPLYVLNGDTSPTPTQTDPTFDHVYELELLETLVTPLNSPFSTPVLDRQIEFTTIVQQQTSQSILVNELFSETMLKKAHYTTFKKEIILELQRKIEGIFYV